MVTDISINTLKEKLNNIFCTENKATHKYSKIWLSEADFGGLYNSGMFILNVKAEHHIESCNNEIKHISSLIFNNLDIDERTLIWRIVVYNAEEQVHCYSEDILVFDIAEAC